MQIRQARTDDVDDLARLRAAWRERPATDGFLDTFRDWFAREQHSRWWWIAVDGDEPAGMVNLKLFERMPSPEAPASRWGYLANLFVMPAHRGSGVGTALVAAVVETARKEGLARVVLSPSELSVPLYARHGFRPATDLLLLPLER